MGLSSSYILWTLWLLSLRLPALWSSDSFSPTLHFLGDSPTIQGLHKLHSPSYAPACHYKSEALPDYTDCLPSPSDAVVSRLTLVCARPLHPRERRVIVPHGPSQCLSWPFSPGQGKLLPQPDQPLPAPLSPKASCSPKFTFTGSQKLPTWLQVPTVPASVPSKAPEAVRASADPLLCAKQVKNPELLRACARQQPSQDLVQESLLPLKKEKTLRLDGQRFDSKP